MSAQEWQTLLRAQRHNQTIESAGNEDRTAFQQDFDRIIFCSAFRRLKDKTQVFPLSHSDYVRTRLTHSLETSSVGRSLGTYVGRHIIQRHQLQDVEASDFGAIVAAACLAHDIGNPPFGHAGEDAIRQWCQQSDLLKKLDDSERADLENFEGNAQGFRIITKLQGRQKSGLELTHAVLGTFMKYPRASLIAENLSGASAKKFGFFKAESAIFNGIAKNLSLKKRAENAYFRHPLAFLVEVADDICYLIVDLEDAARLGFVSYDNAEHFLTAFLIHNQTWQQRFEHLKDAQSRLEYLRAKAIGELIDCAVDAFLENEAAILSGAFDQNLLEVCRLSAAVQTLKEFALEHIYNAPPALEIEIAGFQVIGALLDLYSAAMEDNSTPREKMIRHLFPPQFLEEAFKPNDSPYLRLLSVVDFVSGMTDSYAVSLYRKLTGVGILSA